MTAGAALPALTLIAGGLEFAEYHKTRTAMQHAADTAVMSAFYVPDRHWSKRVRRANDFFDSNFPNQKKVSGIKRRLRGKMDRKRFVLRYEASARINRLFGELNPFAKDKIKVTSTAEMVMGSRRAPRLIASHEAASKTN